MFSYLLVIINLNFGMSLGLHNSFSFELIDRLNKLGRGAQKLMGDNLKLVWAEFSTLS
jgi:hypothetical protein